MWALDRPPRVVGEQGNLALNSEQRDHPRCGWKPRNKTTTESLILAQNERWRRGLGMQVERERESSESRVEWRTGE
jgi:hypothetical protein